MAAQTQPQVRVQEQVLAPGGDVGDPGTPQGSPLQTPQTHILQGRAQEATAELHGKFVDGVPFRHDRLR